VSKEVANKFVEALWKLEEVRDVEALVEIHTEDCSVGNVAVSKTFSGHDGLREFWTDYRKTFDEMKSEFRNVFADGAGHAALEWTTEGTEDGDIVSYGGVSILEIEGDKVKRFMAYFDPRALTEQLVD
jgi:hypothetical protein